MTRKQQNQLLASRETIFGLMKAFEISFNAEDEATRETFRNLCGDMVGALITNLSRVADWDLLNVILEAFKSAFNSKDEAERNKFRNACGGMLTILLSHIESICEKEFN